MQYQAVTLVLVDEEIHSNLNIMTTLSQRGQTLGYTNIDNAAVLEAKMNTSVHKTL